MNKKSNKSSLSKSAAIICVTLAAISAVGIYTYGNKEKINKNDSQIVTTNNNDTFFVNSQLKTYYNF